MAQETTYQRGDRFLRVLAVLDLLMRSKQGITTSEIAEKLDTNQRYVQRDIQYMERAGLHIERDEHARVHIGADSKLPPLQFTKPEAVAVLIALRLLQQMRPRRDEALTAAVGRLAQVMSLKTVTAYLGTMLDALDRLEEGGAREHIETIVVECFIDRVPLEIEYENFKGEVSRRVIRPYFLEPRPDSRTIYVYAFDELSGAMRWFRVDRIRTARKLLIAGTYAVPDDFDITEVTRSSWGIWQAGQELEEVVLRFCGEAAPRVRETEWHPSARLADLPDGGVELRLSVASELEMRPWVLGWGSQVEVIAPASLRAHVAQSMRDGAQMYDTQVSPG